jgi:hypothetical protein
MSIFNAIKNAILGRPLNYEGLQAAVAAQQQAAAASAPGGAGQQAQATVQPRPQAQALSDVDMTQILDQRAASAGQPLNWRTSIVDLMKLLGIDSSLENRKALAHELGYTGDTGDSAAMNIWLHREVMRQLAANGGNVPAGLAD